MLKAGGYSITSFPEGKTFEQDSYMCAHCNAHTWIKPNQRPEDIGGRCTCCNGLLCPKKACNEKCDPLEEKIKRWDERARSLASYGVK